MPEATTQTVQNLFPTVSADSPLTGSPLAG
jgi:hypothetical protein